ncbi:MAG TPA: PorV/PorQ family protein [Chitinophagales bacterium]|nr:PorV/PorQ family protein [Chitinophagales bacterium]
MFAGYRFIVVLLLVCCAATAGAQTIRTYSNEFLALGVGARGLGMGTAQAVSVNDVTAGYWNPAGLTSLTGTQVAAMHAEWFAGIAKYDYAGVALPIADRKRFIGINAIRFGVDDIPNTLNLIEPDGNINYNNITTFSAADYAVLLSYAQMLKKVSIGGSVKVIHRRVGSFATAWGFGLDVGMKYAHNDRLTLGAMLRDATTTVNTWGFNFTPEEKQQLALTDNVIPVNSVELTGQRLILGGAYRQPFGQSKFALLTELNLNITFDGKRNTLIKSDPVSIDPTAGIEAQYNNLIFLRAGINNIQQFRNDTNGDTFTSIQPNVGLGLRIKEVRIDYAFTGLNRVDVGVYSHIISLMIDFTKKDR